jgi:hypothetical protein
MRHGCCTNGKGAGIWEEQSPDDLGRSRDLSRAEPWQQLDWGTERRRRDVTAANQGRRSRDVTVANQGRRSRNVMTAD